jgi:UDP-N-acetylmuramoylalanine-D-glutamate ligase
VTGHQFKWLGVCNAPDKTMISEYDVVVVGAGPTGLSVAAYLLSQGIRCIVYDKVSDSHVLKRLWCLLQSLTYVNSDHQPLQNLAG